MYHKYNTINKPIKVTDEEIKKYSGICNSDPVYMLNQNALADLFRNYPSSTNLTSLRIKSICLNECYSTRIKSIDLIPLVKWISSITNIDSRIRARDPNVVNDMAASKSKGKMTTQDSYSFASKYCHFHNNAYPIFDSYVSDMLCQLQNETDFYSKQTRNKKFTQADLKNYNNFLNIRQAFVDFFGLQTYSVLAIDQFLWRAGRDTYFK
ncbi:MAG: hypothetical protein J6V68_00150 [Clostridia bacterium]|nr:hypothetical protein [Clostridia bacterium]